MLKVFKLVSSSVARKSTSVLSCLHARPRARTFADKPHSDTSSKQVVVQGNENEQRVRVRRARPADVPRVLRFVREHSRSAWPALLAPTPAPSAAAQLVLADYVSRALAQGHSLVAEQLGARRGWLRVRGLALGAALCPWDAAMLERWAGCLRCTRSRRLLHFTAHCLREPALHEKYRVHNILQVIMILPPDAASNPEIVQVLARSAIQRAREAGFPLLRFDVTNQEVAKALEQMELKKEWHLAYDVLPEAMAAEGESATRSQGGAPPSTPADTTAGTATGAAIGTADYTVGTAPGAAIGTADYTVGTAPGAAIGTADYTVGTAPGAAIGTAACTADYTAGTTADYTVGTTANDSTPTSTLASTPDDTPASNPDDTPASTLASTPDDTPASTLASTPVDTSASTPADTPADTPASTLASTPASTLASTTASMAAAPTSSSDRPVNFIAVYTAFTASHENAKTTT